MNLLFLRSFGGVDDLGLFSYIQIILSPLPHDWGPASGTCRRRPRGPSPTRKSGLRGQNHLKNKKKIRKRLYRREGSRCECALVGSPEPPSAPHCARLPRSNLSRHHTPGNPPELPSGDF